MSRVSIGLCLALALASTNIANAIIVSVPTPPNIVTIQDGIDAASNGDTVSVWGPQGYQPPYTYYENVVIHDKDVFVVNRSFLPNGGTGYDSSWDHVVIDGGHNECVVRMQVSENPVLKGFRIQNGYTDECGGGVYCGNGSGSVLKNHILNNSAYLLGGGVCFLGHETDRCWIEDNLIENNTGGGGGGIMAWAMCCDIRRNVVRNNTSLANYGGGIFLRYAGGSAPTSDDSVTDNVVEGNHLTGSAPKGAASWPGSGRDLLAEMW